MPTRSVLLRASLALLALLPSTQPARAAPPAAVAADPRAATLEAMQAELARSMGRLRLQGYEPPYFGSYQVIEQTRHELGGRFGALFVDRTRRSRTLNVDVRVGSYDLDSSGPQDNTIVLGADGPSWSAPRDAPIDGDVSALRNALWLATDEQYKEALSDYFKKKSKGVYRPDEPDRAPSFTREPPSRHVDAPLAFPFDADRWRGVVREATLRFRDHPEIFDSGLDVTAERQVRWFTSSEGSALLTEQIIYSVHLQAVTRALDGQLLEDGRDWYAPTEAGLPGPDEVRGAVDRVVEELLALRKAPAIDPFTGPAILEPEAAGVLFHEALGHRLEGERMDDDQDGQTFRGQIGQRILPSFLTLVDDPSLQAVGGVPLNGFYRFDDQGVPGQRTVLVRDGTLEGYLLSRKPVKPFTRSNGHGRAQGSRQPVSRMSNLILTSKHQVDAARLKRLLMEEARRQGKPFGLMIRDITGGDTNTTTFGYQAFKGTPRMVYRVDAKTGAEQLVRGVELVGTPLSSVNRVLATGDRPQVFNGYCGAESGYVPVSTVAPAVLVGELELQRVGRASDRSPILPPPWAEQAGAPAAPAAQTGKVSP